MVKQATNLINICYRIWTRNEFIKEQQINLGSPRRGKAAGCHGMDANTAKRKVLSLNHLRRHENLS